jgi:hypothetical protein
MRDLASPARIRWVAYTVLSASGNRKIRGFLIVLGIEQSCRRSRHSSRRPRRYSSPIMEERIMSKTIGTLIAAAALALSGSAFAQSNNTLATPSTVSPAANTPSASGYGTPGSTNSDSGMGAGAQNPGSQNGMSMGTTSGNAYGVNNTLATPSTASPANSK